jgi:hypothetical protein
VVYIALVYTNFLASLQKKTVRGHTYWQLVESRRVNGKPRPIVLAHLGKADDLLARLQQSPKPFEAAIRDSAAIAALWQIAQDLDLAGLIQPTFRTSRVEFPRISSSALTQVS